MSRFSHTHRHPGYVKQRIRDSRHNHAKVIKKMRERIGASRDIQFYYESLILKFENLDSSTASIIGRIKIHTNHCSENLVPQYRHRWAFLWPLAILQH